MSSQVSILHHHILITFSQIDFPDPGAGHENKTALSDTRRAEAAQELEDQALAWWQRSMRGEIKAQHHISVGGMAGLHGLGVAVQGTCVHQIIDTNEQRS